MRIWPFPRKAATPETKSLTTATSWAELFDMAAPTAAGVAVGATDALRVPAVAGAIQIISEAVASLDVMVKRIEGGAEIDVPDHPVLALLRDEANDWTSGFELIRQIVADALMSDWGGMVWVNRVGGEPRELLRYRAGMLSCETDTNTGERQYRLSARPIPSRDVIHLLPPLGVAPLTLAREAIGISIALDRHVGSLFANGARPSGILKIPKMAEDAVKTVRDAWNATHGGGRSGKTAVLLNEADFLPLTMTSTDGQFLENRRFQIGEIARAFNLPVSLLGDLERATWGNSEQHQKLLIGLTLEPWLRALEGALRRALFSDAERATHVIRFDREDFSRADLSIRATTINSLIASQTINPNEGRAWLGLPPRAGGDEFRNPNITQTPAPPPAKEDPTDATE